MKHKEMLKEIIEKEKVDLINYWIENFDEKEKEDEYRYYNDFLSFFEECIDSNLNPHSAEADTLKHFLEKIIEIKGEEIFFNFKDSVYTCYLKFPILKKLEEKGYFYYEIVSKIIAFFESLTSKIIIEILKRKKEFQNSVMNELEERDAPISEIWNKVIMVSIVGTLDSNRILKIIDKILSVLFSDEIEHVIIDIGAIRNVNSEAVSQIIKLNNAIHFMGAKVYITGITPVIAKNLTKLNINLGDIKTFSTTKKAMEYIIGY